MTGNDLYNRIEKLAGYMFESKHLVVFTGAGISTESGLPDFRGPDGVWTRQEKGLPVQKMDFSRVVPNSGHLAILELQKIDKLTFLISQNIDNLHLKSGIKPELLAELHGNIARLRCVKCDFTLDNLDDVISCPICGGELGPSVVDFGQSLPRKDLDDAYRQSQECDLFIVVGSSLIVYPAADMPRVALNNGARLVIINQGKTPLDNSVHLRFDEQIGNVLPAAVDHLKRLMGLT